MVTRFYLLHMVVMGLHVHNIDVVTLTPETVGSFGVRAVTHLCRQHYPSRTKLCTLPGPRHRGLTNMQSAVGTHRAKSLIVRKGILVTSINVYVFAPDMAVAIGV